MAKDPRFNFYPDNFEGGTDGFTLEQDGAYLRLLILQFRNGSFTEEQALDKLSMRCRGNAVAYTTLWKFLMPKFIPKNFDGVNYFNDRLALEMEKSRKTSERQTVTAIKRWQKDKKNDAVGIATGDATASATGDAFSSNSSIVFKASIVGKEKKERTTVKEKSTNVQIEKFNPSDHIPVDWRKDQFSELWADFEEMRRKAKKPLTTNRAIKGCFDDLVKFSGGSYQLAEEIVLNAIKRNWLTFYEPKQTNKPQNGHDPRYSATFVKDKA